MKRKTSILSLSARSLTRGGSAAFFGLALFAAVNNASGQSTYYWNQNSTSAGWGTGGTWSTSSAVFTAAPENALGTAVTASTATGDTLNIGSSTTGFAGGTITVSGTQSIGSIITGSANTTAGVSVTSGTLTFAASGTVTNNSSQGLVIDSLVAGAATRLDLNATGGGITMSGSGNTYTGITYINSGTVTSNNAASLGASGTDANRTVVASGARLNFNNTPRTYTERLEIAGAGVGGLTGALTNSQTSTTLNGQVSLSANATSYSSAGTLTYGGGIVLGSNALTFNVAGGTQTVQTTAISGSSGSIIKSGNGTLNLNVASSYTGATNVNAGTLSINNNTSLGTTAGNTTVASGATIYGTAPLSALAEAFNISGTGVGGIGALRFGGGATTNVTGAVTLAGNSTIGTDGGVTLNMSGGIDTAGNVLTLAPTGTAFNINTVGISGTNGSIITSGTVSLNAVSSYSGGTTLSAGTLNIGTSTTALGSTSGQLTVNGGTLNMASHSLTVGNLTGSGGVISGTSGTRTLTIGDGNTGGGNYQGQINNGSGGTTALTKTGNGTITLSGSNGYTGGTVVSEGILSLGHATNTLTDGGAVNVNGGTLALGTNTDTVGAVTLTSGSITGSGAGKLTGTGSAFDVRSGTISAKLGGTVGLTKTTAGTVTISSDNSSGGYTGATAVNEGTLVINGNISTSTTTVASGATIGGSGTTGGLTVQSGGFITPGNSAGTLSVNGNYAQAGLYTAEINGLTPGTGHDQIAVIGTVNVTGGTLATIFTGSYSLNDILFILANDLSDAITGTFTGLAQDAIVTSYGGFDWKISYVGDSGSSSFTGGNDIALMAVIPEPRAALLGGLGLLALLRRRR